MMRPDVKTLAEYLAGAGYRTGLFGKWHLGDNYPLRPEDRGFQETLWSQGGGLAQPIRPAARRPEDRVLRPDPEAERQGGEDEGLLHRRVHRRGAEVHHRRQQEAVLRLRRVQRPARARSRCRRNSRSRTRSSTSPRTGFPKIGQPWATKKLNADEIAKAYGMIENIDTNFGRLMKALDDAKLADNTIVIFLTDNGPGGVRWNAGLRNRKGTVYEGGIRVPCYVRWPAEVKAGRVDRHAAGAHRRARRRSSTRAASTVPDRVRRPRAFAPLLGRPNTGRGRTARCSSSGTAATSRRSIRAFAARGPRYKLVQAAGVPPGAKWTPKYELFDISSRPVRGEGPRRREAGRGRAAEAASTRRGSRT